MPRDAATILREAGCDCVHVGEMGMSQAEDGEIISWARDHQRAVVTLDADFHAELAVSGASRPSVIRLRIQGLDGPTVAKLVKAIVSEHGSALLRGCMVSAKARKTTVHYLPIGTIQCQ